MGYRKRGQGGSPRSGLSGVGSDSHALDTTQEEAQVLRGKEGQGCGERDTVSLILGMFGWDAFESSNVKGQSQRMGSSSAVRHQAGDASTNTDSCSQALEQAHWGEWVKEGVGEEASRSTSTQWLCRRGGAQRGVARRAGGKPGGGCVQGKRLSDCKGRWQCTGSVRRQPPKQVYFRIPRTCITPVVEKKEREREK